MKTFGYLFIFLAFLLTSCSLDDGSDQNFNFEVMPISSVEVPEEFVFGETYEISVSYNKPSDCYLFNDFLYSVQGAERSIAVVNTVYSSSTGCAGDPTVETVSFDFTVSSIETHIFKFFQGASDNGFDEYHIIEIPVVQGD